MIDYRMGDFLATLRRPPISVTGATTALLNRMHDCTGTSADYTLALPSAVGCAGAVMGFRMGSLSALSKFVDLDGSGSETIDDALTRRMWALETAFLVSDNVQWRKAFGRTIPMQCLMYLTSDQTAIADSAIVKVNIASTKTDNTGRMADTTNKKILVPRAGSYDLKGGVVGISAAAISLLEARVHISSATDALDVGFSNAYAASVYTRATFAAPSPVLTTSDYFEIYAYKISSGSTNIIGSGGSVNLTTVLSAVEIPSW